MPPSRTLVSFSCEDQMELYLYLSKKLFQQYYLLCLLNLN